MNGTLNLSHIFAARCDRFGHLACRGFRQAVLPKVVVDRRRQRRIVGIAREAFGAFPKRLQADPGQRDDAPPQLASEELV